MALWGGGGGKGKEAKKRQKLWRRREMTTSDCVSRGRNFEVVCSAADVRIKGPGGIFLILKFFMICGDEWVYCTLIDGAKVATARTRITHQSVTLKQNCKETR